MSFRTTALILGVQGLACLLLLVGWLAFRDPWLHPGYRVHCPGESGARAAAVECAGAQALTWEYFRLYPETGRVLTWVDSSNPRGETLDGCVIEDALNWSCPLAVPGQRVGMRDGTLYREPFAGTLYVSQLDWWWQRLRQGGT